MSLPRLYYTLPELAEKWGKTESDLLQMAAAGELELSAKYRGWALDQSVCRILMIKDYIQLHPHSVEAFMDGVTKIDSARFKGKPIMLPVDEFNLILLKQWASEQDPCFDIVMATSFKICDLKDFRILPAEVARMEAKFPELAGRDEAAVEAADHTHKETAVQDCILYDIQSQVELAKRCSVTPKTVSNWTKKGLLTEEVPGAGRRYSTAATVKWLEQNNKHNELELFNNSK